MDPTLARAYKIIFGDEPEAGMKNWQIAEELLKHFSVPKLGEELAGECIHKIVNYISYPDRETMTRIVSHAEGLAKELWDELPDEPHMAEIERLERLKNKPR
jgi:hypothetical protein